MASNSSVGGEGDDPNSPRQTTMKQFHSAGRGFWNDVSDADWTNFRWQLKHRVTTLEQLRRLLPTLTPEEDAEMDNLERAGSILSTLKSKARQVLKRSSRRA